VNESILTELQHTDHSRHTGVVIKRSWIQLTDISHLCNTFRQLFNTQMRFY